MISMEEGPTSPAAAPGEGQRTRLGWGALEPALRLVSASVMVGAGCGAVIGGVGGRLAMRLLFITSDDSVKGTISDDGFEIGRFTLGDTVGLVVVTAFIGVIAALFLLLAHPFVAFLGPRVVPVMAVFYGVVGGAMMVHRDGIDFNALAPIWLAIVLFVGICAGFGAAAAALLRAAARDGGWAQSLPRWALVAPLVTLVFPPFLLVAAGAAAANLGERLLGPQHRWWRLVHVAALCVMSAIFAVGAVDLVRDSAALV
jgi:hypothetical protein